MSAFCPVSPVVELFWGTLIVGGITFVALAGALLVRRWATWRFLSGITRLRASSMQSLGCCTLWFLASPL